MSLGETDPSGILGGSVAAAGDRTRLVLNLKSPSNYSARLDGNALLVVLESGGSTQLIQDIPAGSGENDDYTIRLTRQPTDTVTVTVPPCGSVSMPW